MIAARYKKQIASIGLGIFLFGQFAMVSTGLFIPKKAEAWTFPTIQIGDVYSALKDIALGALRQVALEVSNKFLTKLTAKLQDKYKIRNYLYYDQVLTNYYLNNYISDKIDDPDLRRIYGMLSSAFVTGQSTGTNRQPDPTKAIIPQLNKAISDYYLKRQGGIDPNKIYNPKPGVTDREYFATAQAYFYNPPSFTEQNLRAQFGAFQAAATTAAQLEVIVGNGLKAGRIVGGTCKMPAASSNSDGSLESRVDQEGNGAIGLKSDSSWLVKIGLVNIAQAQSTPEDPDFVDPAPTPAPLEARPNTNFTETPPPSVQENRIEAQSNTPATCEAAGGTWQKSALDQARAFIDNPTAAVAGWLDGAIHTKLKSNFDPNSFWAVIGSLAGSYLFNQVLNLNKKDDTKGVLNEDPNYTYDPTTDPTAGANEGLDPSVGIDIDGDSVSDGFDYDLDGELDVCTYGGADSGRTATPGPPCKGSREALSNPATCSLNLSVTNSVNSTVNGSASNDPTTGELNNNTTGNATSNATGTVNQDCPPDGSDSGGGQCVQYISETSPQAFRGRVVAAMERALARAETSGLADQFATRGGNIEAFRDLVIQELNTGGDEASTAYNGNCSVSPNQISVHTAGSMTGEAYDVVREENGAKIRDAASATRSRPLPMGTATWNFYTTGQP